MEKYVILKPEHFSSLQLKATAEIEEYKKRVTELKNQLASILNDKTSSGRKLSSFERQALSQPILRSYLKWRERIHPSLKVEKTSIKPDEKKKINAVKTEKVKKEEEERRGIGVKRPYLDVSDDDDGHLSNKLIKMEPNEEIDSDDPASLYNKFAYYSDTLSDPNARPSPSQVDDDRTEFVAEPSDPTPSTPYRLWGMNRAAPPSGSKRRPPRTGSGIRKLLPKLRQKGWLTL